MLSHLLTALAAFTVGFLAAALLAAGRRQDAARGDALLAQAAAGLARSAPLDDEPRADGCVDVARRRLEALQQALETRDALHTA
jgi:hypothetical protein